MLRFALTGAVTLALFAGDLGRASLTSAPAAAQGRGIYGGVPVFRGYGRDGYGYGSGHGYPAGYGYRGGYGHPYGGGYPGAYGYPGGYGYDYDRYRRRDHVDTGAILLGALVLGGIAIAASQASRAPRYSRGPYGYPQQGQGYPRAGYGYPQTAYNSDGTNAFDACARAAQARGAGQVSSLADAGRDGAGQWVTGYASNGGRFSCAFDGRQVTAFRFSG